MYSISICMLPKIKQSLIFFRKTNVLNVFLYRDHGFRYLYSQNALGIDRFIEMRERAQYQFRNMKQNFKERMLEFTEENNSNMIFTEDLKNILLLAEESDVDLVIKMMRKFGPVAMRMFYYFQKPDDALKVFHMKELNGFFDQIMSYQILLDLLYENAQYNDVLRSYDYIKTKQNQANKYPKHCVVIVLAACYKLNNKACMEYMVNLWRELKQAGHVPMRKAVTFAAGLAYNQKEYNTAIEILSNTKDINYYVIKCINILCLAELGRIEDALMLLKSFLSHDTYEENNSDDSNNAAVPKNIIENLKKLIEGYENKEWNYELDKIVSYLKTNQRITDETLDQMLCKEIASPPFQPTNLHRSSKFRAAKYYSSENQRRKFTPRRPSLYDLE